MTHPAAETIHRYVEAFATLDPDAVTPFYNCPCVFIAPFGDTVAADASTARGVAAAMMEHARSAGYSRTEIRGLAVRELAANLASLGGTFVRLNAEGESVGQFGFTYVMRRDGSAWKIVVAVAHDPPTGDI